MRLKLVSLALHQPFFLQKPLFSCSSHWHSQPLQPPSQGHAAEEAAQSRPPRRVTPPRPQHRDASRGHPTPGAGGPHVPPPNPSPLPPPSFGVTGTQLEAEGLVLFPLPSDPRRALLPAGMLALTFGRERAACRSLRRCCGSPIPMSRRSWSSMTLQPCGDRKGRRGSGAHARYSPHPTSVPSTARAAPWCWPRGGSSAPRSLTSPLQHQHSWQRGAVALQHLQGGLGGAVLLPPAQHSLPRASSPSLWVSGHIYSDLV